MKRRGPKPTPTGLKLMRGNPGKRAINEDEPQPTPEIPSPPAHLSKYALEEWQRITVELYQLGLLSQIDRAALTVYCTAWGRHVEAETRLRVEGHMLKGKSKPTGQVDTEGKPILEEGGPYPNPWVGASNTAMALMQSLIAEFGLSPASRTRLSVKPPSAKKESLFG